MLKVKDNKKRLSLETAILVDSQIQSWHPRTLEELDGALCDIGCNRYKLKPIHYRGQLQGHKVIINGVKLPLERGHFYTIIKQMVINTAIDIPCIIDYTYSIDNREGIPDYQISFFNLEV